MNPTNSASTTSADQTLSQAMGSGGSRTALSRVTSRPTSRVSSGGILATLAAAAAISISALSLGADLRFKSGQTWRGEINDVVEVVYTEGGREMKMEGKVLRADTTMVVIEGTIAGKVSKKSIFFGDVKSMKSTAAGSTAPAAPTAPATPEGGAPATPATNGEAASRPKISTTIDAKSFKGVFFMPIEGTVGLGMRHDEIEAIGKEADKFGPGQIIVLEIDSPGGLVLEAERIHETMLNLKKRHRVVAWIKEAISAAAFTALHCDEIYFMNVGAMGSMTMFSGTTAAKGESLAGWLDLAGRVAKEGGRNPHIARCMIKVELELSYDIPEGGGPKDAIFREDTKGKVVLDRSDTMLTFNAAQALACGFSDGTADTVEELAKVMGLPEWKEVNDTGRKIYRDWQKLLTEGTDEVIKLVSQYNYKGTSSGDPEKILGNRIRITMDLLRWWDKCWSCMFNAGQQGVGVPEKQQLEDILKELRRQLAEVKQAKKSRGATN